MPPAVREQHVQLSRRHAFGIKFFVDKGKIPVKHHIKQMSKEKPDDAKKYTKSNLPEKICAACGKPMTWRKRWERVWAEVKYCSERCRKNKNGERQ